MHKDKKLMSPAQIISALTLLVVGAVITQRVFSTSSTLAWDLKIALLAGVLGFGYFLLRWSWLTFTPATAAQAPAQQQLPATALAPLPPPQPVAPVHAAHPRTRAVTPTANPEIVPTPKPSAGDPSLWSEIEKLSSTPQAAARREDSRILEEAYSRLVSAHLKVATSLKDFQPSNGAGGTPNLDSRKVEGIWATRRMGYDSPVFFTKYEIRISNGHLLFADKDAKAPFYETPVGTPNYGDDFLAAVRRSMEPQIRAEWHRATRDAGASAGFDLFKTLTSPELSPEWRSRILEYVDVRTQLNQSQVEMDKQSAKLDAMLPADDGVPPKTPTS